MSSKRKALSSSSSGSNLNSDFCDALLELAEFEKNVNRNQFKHNAYRKAQVAIAALDYRLESGKQAKQIPGVGNKIADKIDEIIRTGKLRKLESIREDEETSVINLLNRVSGIGPAKSKELYDIGVRSIADLKDHATKLTHAQRVGVKYFNDFELRIPRSEVRQVLSMFSEKVSALDKNYLFDVCGSYRRRAETSGDIDVLLTHTKYQTEESQSKQNNLLHRVVQELTTEGLIVDTISKGETKFMGVCKLGDHHRRLDIRLLPLEHYYCGLLYFTGSDLFNQNMRAHAVQKGFKLNEYSLRPLLCGEPQEPLPISCERDIFDYIDYPYKEPWERK